MSGRIAKAVDMFCGWGGTTLGAEQAGVSVVWAADHWPLAVTAHAANHPHVAHVCQDLRQADWTALPAYDLLLASPCCQPHSAASQPRRAGKATRRHDSERATAWAVVDCADATAPRAIIVENVVGFRDWILYPEWRGCLVKLGYCVEERVEIATAFGVPQRRERLFVLCTRRPMPALRPLGCSAEPAFGPCIDDEAGGWRLNANAAPGGLSRINAALAKVGPRCLVQHTTGHSGIPLTEPIRTITTKDQWILVDGERHRKLTVREHARGMGFPDSYQWPAGVSRANAIKGLGGAVPPPMARAMVREVMEAA